MFLVDSGTTHYDPPICLMPMPLKVGDSWEWEKPDVEKWKFKAINEEEVEVPAGKIKAIRIEGEGILQRRKAKLPSRTMKCTEWILPGLPTMRCRISGLLIIKSVIRIGDGSEITDGEATEVLKSFTPGKK